MRHAAPEGTRRARKKALLPTLGAMVLLGAGVAAFGSPASAEDPSLCGTAPATIVVPAGTTTPVDGTAGNDVIYVNGTATVNALGGDDIVCGAPGATAATGGTWDGGEGADSMTSASAALLGGPGNDRLTGAYSSIEGGAGNDIITGGAGDNTLSGGDGDDQLRGGPGADVFDGGLGNDTLVSSKRDKIRVGGATQTTIDVGDRTIDGPQGADTYTGRSTIWAPGATDEIFLGSERFDVFVSDGGHDRVYGQGGDDTLIVTHARLVDGGPGNDAIDAWFGGKVRGGSGNDAIRTLMNRQDRSGVVVEPFDISGNDGDDVIRATSVNVGGVFAGPIAPADRWVGLVRGGEGSDRLDFAPAAYSVKADLLSQKATWAGGEMTLKGMQALSGTKNRDRLLGDNARNRLSGGGGDDRLVGRDGNDVLTGGDGLDEVRGGYGKDTCSAEVVRGC